VFQLHCKSVAWTLSGLVLWICCYQALKNSALWSSARRVQVAISPPSPSREMRTLASRGELARFWTQTCRGGEVLRFGSTTCPPFPFPRTRDDAWRNLDSCDTAAKKNRRPPDSQRHSVELLDVNRKARTWAEKAIAFREAAKSKQADAAERMCKHWLAKAARIQAMHEIVLPNQRKAT
jgi:hypothetical protein